MATKQKIVWTLYNGVYRAECNGWRIWVCRDEPGSWQYGTAGGTPIQEAQRWNPATTATINRGNWDVQCVYGAPRKHLAMQDAILLAENLRPQDRPTHRLYIGAMRRVWDVNPALLAANAAVQRAVQAAESSLATTVARYAHMTTEGLEYEAECCESVLDRNPNSEFAPINRVCLAAINAELARRIPAGPECDDGMSWYEFRAYNRAPLYGYGTESEAWQYQDALNCMLAVNLYQVDGPLAEHSPVIQWEIANESGLNLADELQAIAEESV